MENNPCNGCTERWVTSKDRCHSHCSRYKEAKEKDLAKKKAHKEYRDLLNAIEGCHTHRALKMSR